MTNARALSIAVLLGGFAIAGLFAINFALRRRPVASLEAPEPAASATCARSIAFGPTCGACIAASCCAELDACYASSECVDLNDCAVNCGEEAKEHGDAGGDECAEECEANHPASVALFRAWDRCATDRCAAVCPPRR